MQYFSTHNCEELFPPQPDEAQERTITEKRSVGGDMTKVASGGK